MKILSVRNRSVAAAFVVAMCVAATAGTAFAALRLPSVVSSNMVLQRDRVVPLWGWADAGAEVTVTLGKSEKRAKAGADGKWMVKLDATPAGGPHQITIVAGAERVVLENVLFGEVWLCSGQSNMAWSVRQAKRGGEEIAAAKHPDIRLFHIPRRVANAPQDTADAAWKACSPESVANFSAVGYFFGRGLLEELEGVPIGLIGSAWGGTRIEPWTPLVGFEAVDKVKDIGAAAKATSAARDDRAGFAGRAEKWAVAVRAAAGAGGAFPPAPQMPGDFDHRAPTALYNGMIAPIVPYALRGAIWYQGESNNGEGMLYHEKMKALIGGWRSVFENPGLAFHFVQLAPFKYGTGEQSLPSMWEAQCATLAVPGTGMVVITDIGNVRNIHPTNKQDVGKRLALWAMAKQYGKDDLVYSGPLYESMAVEGATVRIRFAHAGGGLAARDGKPLSEFTIAGEDGKFVPARAEIDGETVVVSAAGVAAPKSVRFGWHQMTNPNLMNKAGLPASPFKTDGWKGATGG